MPPSKDIQDPTLEYEDGSEIAAAVDVAIRGQDHVFRPIYINQDEEILQLTPRDAERLYKFLGKALEFVKEYEERTIQ